MTHGIKLKFANGFAGALTIFKIAPRCPSARNYLIMVILNLLAAGYAAYALITSGGEAVHLIIVAAILLCFCAQILIFTYSVFLMRIGPILTLSKDKLWIDCDSFVFQQGNVQTHFSWVDISCMILHSNLGYFEIRGTGHFGKAGDPALAECDHVYIPLRFMDNSKILKEFSHRVSNCTKSQERVFEGEL